MKGVTPSDQNVALKLAAAPPALPLPPPWYSAAEIADYLKTGFTPDYDSVGGTMVEVQANMAELPDEDRAAIAAYLKAVPTVKP